MGIGAFVMKPVSGREMAVTVRQVLARKKEEAALLTGNIIVVHDDENIRLTLRQMLESSGYDVSEARDGKVALWLFKEKPADLIITDVIMLEKEGLEAIMELKCYFQDVRIISISGGGEEEKKVLNISKKLGVDFALTQPFEKEALLKSVKELLA